MARDERDLIAIIGMSGRFPGAGSVGALWQMLLEGREGLRRLAPGELEVDAAIAARPDFVPVCGTVEGIEDFDFAFFGLTREEAVGLDPQHRVALEHAWDALEDACVDPLSLKGRPVSVLLGSGTNTYGLVRLLRQRAVGVSTFQTLLGFDRDYLATRVSYKLGLTGPALTVSTACSTGLVAVALAATQLLDHTVDLAIAGGVSIAVPHRIGYLYEAGGIFAPDGHCRPFDAAAGGTVPASGAGVVVLKRLLDARRDGDPIRAVLAGVAINNDGDGKVGYTAPSVGGQADVIAAAQALAGVGPGEVTFVETHGTATQLGDAVELAALGKVFAASAPGSVLLGGLKSNLGHMNAASGVGGLIKAALMVEAGEIPPTLHFRTPSRALGDGAGPFTVVATRRPWPEGRPRRVGVSSFGFGGTNAHAIVEAEPPAPAVEEAPGPRLLLLSARTPTALAVGAERLAEHLRSAAPPLGPVARTLHRGRAPLGARLAVVAEGAEEAAAALAAPVGRWRVSGRARPRKVVFLLTGQGAAEPGMGRDLYAASPAFRASLDRAAELLRPSLGLDLRALLFAGGPDAAARLASTRFAQPALVALSLGVAAALGEAGVRPDALVGHSVGEIAAAALAGAISEEDALQFAARRGQQMEALAPGRMLAVAASEEALRPLPPGVEIAVYNGPEALVLGGDAACLEPLAARLEGQGRRTRWLETGRAFHTAAMEPALAGVLGAARSARWGVARIPWTAGLTGSWHAADRPLSPAYWAEHARRPVRFDRALARVYADLGPAALVALGPGRALADLALAHPDRPAEAVCTHVHPAPSVGEDGHRGLLRALGALWCAGVNLAPSATGGSGPRVRLPGVVFERSRCWNPGALPEQAPPASRPFDPNEFVDVLDES